MFSVLLYVAALLLILVLVNVVLVRAIRAEKRRQAEDGRLKADRRRS